MNMWWWLSFGYSVHLRQGMTVQNVNHDSGKTTDTSINNNTLAYSYMKECNHTFLCTYNNKTLLLHITLFMWVYYYMNKLFFLMIYRITPQLSQIPMESFEGMETELWLHDTPCMYACAVDKTKNRATTHYDSTTFWEFQCVSLVCLRDAPVWDANHTRKP